jgi:hypothetical protein
MSIIKRKAVRLDERPHVPGASAPFPGGRCAPLPGARLLRADGVVRAIEVTCACGEVTVLELEYADQPADPLGHPEELDS